MLNVDNESLVVDLIRFVADEPRAYQEVMAAWRTSCPRLTIWEDAVDCGFIEVRDGNVLATEQGKKFVAGQRNWSAC